MKESGDVSYKRQHLILSFGPHLDHSTVIQPFLSFFIDLELEWDWNDEMTLKWMEWSYEEENIQMEWRNEAEFERFQN